MDLPQRREEHYHTEIVAQVNPARQIRKGQFLRDVVVQDLGPYPLAHASGTLQGQIGRDGFARPPAPPRHASSAGQRQVNRKGGLAGV